MSSVPPSDLRTWFFGDAGGGSALLNRFRAFLAAHPDTAAALDALRKQWKDTDGPNVLAMVRMDRVDADHAALDPAAVSFAAFALQASGPFHEIAAQCPAAQYHYVALLRNNRSAPTVLLALPRPA